MLQVKREELRAIAVKLALSGLSSHAPHPRHTLPQPDTHSLSPCGVHPAVPRPWFRACVTVSKLSGADAACVFRAAPSGVRARSLQRARSSRRVLPRERAESAGRRARAVGVQRTRPSGGRVGATRPAHHPRGQGGLQSRRRRAERRVRVRAACWRGDGSDQMRGARAGRAVDARHGAGAAGPSARTCKDWRTWCCVCWVFQSVVPIGAVRVACALAPELGCLRV